MEEELEETSLRNRSTASRHHHHQRRRAKKPPPPPSTTNYDDVFGGPPRHAVPFSGVPDDYSEVFGGVSVSCSIPFLDLPTGQMDEWDYASGESVNGVDYGEIFGRCDFAEFAVPYEELFGRGRRDEGEMDMHFASANGRSSFKSRSGPQTIDPSVFIQEYSNEDTIPYLEDANFSVSSEEIPMEYNTSYNKSSRTKELLHTTASVPQPQTGFTFVVEPDKPLPEHPPLVNEDVATHENTVKPNPRSSANSQSISNKEPVSSGVPFLDVADVNLLTQSVNLPPPARPPTPKFLINERQKINTFSKTDSVSSFSTEAEQPSLPQQEKLKPFLKSDSLPPNFDFVPNLKLDKREKPKLKSRPITFSKSESLPPGFGSELDAMKEAMEFAQARLKTAKELHEKKREGKITELPLKKKHVKEENLEASEGEKPRVLRSISLASNFSKSREFMKVQVGVMATQGTHELEKSGKWISDEEFHELTSIEPTKEKGNKIGITVTEPLVETNRESAQINGLPPTEVGLTENLNTDVNATENLEPAREIKYSEDLKREEKATIGALEILTGSQEPVIEEVPVITQNNFELEKETGEGDTEALKENANGIPNVEERENTGEVEGETEDGRGCKMKVGMETEEEDRNNLDEEMKRQRKKEELEKERQRENEMKEEEEKERAQKLEEEKERALQLEEEKEGAHKLEEEKERALQLEEEKERAHKLEEEKERKLQMEMEREEKERREQERIMAEEEERLERERIKKWEEESERERLEKEKEEEQRMLAEERERERKLEEERQEEKMREKEMVRKLEEEKERERKLAEEIGKERGRVRKLEEEREQERERVRRLEEEKQREREMALKLEKEKERERKLEEEIEKERGRIRKLEEEREQEREKVRKLEEERELERERVRKLEEEREQERERVRKLEEEREKERIEKEREQKEREQRERERIVKEREQKEMEKKLEAEKEKQRMEKEKEEREKQRRMEKEREEKEMAMRLEAERRRLERERAEEREKMTKLQGEKAKERKTEARKSDEEREREKRMKEKERKREGRKSDEEREKAWERKSDEERERERERRARKERGIEEREREREEEERKREREKDRLAVERATQERAERIAMERITAARQRAVENREKEEVNTRGGGEGFEKKRPKGEEEKKERDGDRNAREARLRAERAAVERATAEARERAIEKAKAEAEKGRDRLERFKSFNRISSQDHAQEAHFKRTQSDSALNQGHGESALRHKARLERQQRTAERAAKALAEKNRRDIMAQREQAERDRIAEHLDADVKRWSSGKEGNLRALLSTLQYILGQNSGWQPIHLTEVITAADVKKAYRKATLYVHPDKLQQRGASIQQKYICEKVFDLLKEAWNKFNSEER